MIRRLPALILVGVAVWASSIVAIEQADFYVLFRVEQLEQGERCTISWKRIPTPERQAQL